MLDPFSTYTTVELSTGHYSVAIKSIFPSYNELIFGRSLASATIKYLPLAKEFKIPARKAKLWAG